MHGVSFERGQISATISRFCSNPNYALLNNVSSDLFLYNYRLVGNNKFEGSADVAAYCQVSNIFNGY